MQSRVQSEVETISQREPAPRNVTGCQGEAEADSKEGAFIRPKTT